jgi:hypothetical protein
LAARCSRVRQEKLRKRQQNQISLLRALLLKKPVFGR